MPTFLENPKAVRTANPAWALAVLSGALAQLCPLGQGEVVFSFFGSLKPAALRPAQAPAHGLDAPAHAFQGKAEG